MTHWQDIIRKRAQQLEQARPLDQLERITTTSLEIIAADLSERYKTTIPATDLLERKDAQGQIIEVGIYPLVFSRACDEMYMKLKRDGHTDKETLAQLDSLRSMVPPAMQLSYLDQFLDRHETLREQGASAGSLYEMVMSRATEHARDALTGKPSFPAPDPSGARSR